MRIKDLFLDIASEELAHMEVVATLVNLLNGHQLDTQGTTVGNVEASVLTGLTPMLANASGYPFTSTYINETGDLAPTYYLTSQQNSAQRLSINIWMEGVIH